MRIPRHTGVYLLTMSEDCRVQFIVQSYGSCRRTCNFRVYPASGGAPATAARHGRPSGWSPREWGWSVGKGAPD